MDNRTITAQALRRGIPLWAVALGSATVALLIVTAIYFVITRSTEPATKTIAPSSPSSSASAALAQSTAAPVVPSAGTTAGIVSVAGGPFSGARAAFSHAIEPPPPAPPPTQPTASASPNPSAIPVSALAAATPTTATAAPQTVSAPAGGGAAHAHAASADTQGLLTVVCTPACDQVIDNGKLLGPAPIFRLKVATGEHHLQLKNGRQTRVSNTIVTAGDLRSVVVTMQ